MTSQLYRLQFKLSFMILSLLSSSCVEISQNYFRVYDISQWVKIRLREVLHCLAQFFLKNLFNRAALMRQVCGVEKTWINAANVVAQTSLCCTFFPVFSPYVILWHFTFEKPLHPKYFFMIRKNIIYLLTIWQHAAVLVLNLFWYKIQGLVCNDSNDDRGRGSVTIFQKSKYLQTITVKNWGVLLLKKMFLPISWHWLGI